MATTAKPAFCDEAMRICDKEKILCFESFLRVKNNFQLHFTVGFCGDIYRKQNAYRKCAVARKDFCSLVQRLMQLGERHLYTDECQLELYEAYKMMRPYAETNWEMFQ